MIPCGSPGPRTPWCLGERRRGDNTDVFGIVSAVRESLDGVDRTGVHHRRRRDRALGHRGQPLNWAHGRVSIVARRPEAAGAAVATARALGLEVEVLPWSRAGAAMDCGLIVSTVPGDAAATLAPASPQPVGAAGCHVSALADDSQPDWSSRGGVVVPGSRMLLWQAVRQVELMTGSPAPVAAMDRALADAG